MHQSGSGIMLSKREVLQYLLEGTAGSLVKSIGDDDEKGADHHSNHSLSSGSELVSSSHLSSHVMYIYLVHFFFFDIVIFGMQVV